MVEEKVCFKCNRGIEPKSNYYAFSEYNNKTLIRTDYAHRVCWDEFLRKLTDTNEAMGIIRQLKGKLVNLGVLDKDPEEFVLK